MKPEFQVQLTDYKTINHIPAAWTNADYKTLLTRLEIGDISTIPDNELKDMCQMALTDLTPADAAKQVLTYLLDETLNEGQIDNLAHEMEEEPMWEEFADMACHEAIFNANQLLYTAFNGKFPRPEAASISFEVSTKHPEGQALLEQPTEALLVRLIAGGMDEHSTLHRLFSEEIAKGTLPEAESIIWQFIKQTGANTTFEIIASTYWLAAIKDTNTYTVTAFADPVVELV
ncbi:MAG: hypothetical protein AAGJ18_08910 [Bacteroidota bacterium]